jgi:hypothetical protein
MLAAVVIVAIGCAHAASAPVTAERSPEPGSTAPQNVDDRNPTAEDIVRILAQSGLRFATVDPGRRWQVTLAGHQRPVRVDVLYSDSFTVVLGKLFTLPAGADRDIYKAIAERNYDLEQMKISVDKDGEVFASFEVPTRIIDRRELLENIASLAAALDALTVTDGAGAHPPAVRPPVPRPVPPRAPPAGVESIAAPGPIAPAENATVL